MSQTEHNEYIAKTLEGLEPILAEELEKLGAQRVRALRRAVAFDADKRLMYKAAYTLRTALRLLKPLHAFSAYNERSLYRAVQEVDWRQLINTQQTLAVDAVTQGEVFTHARYAALLVKDAVVDQFRERYGRRPSVDTETPDLRVHLHVAGTQCSLLLDASGDSLHRRSYRSASSPAPLNEVLAAGMVLLSGWRGERAFCDPMCGSGTIAIEAAMIAAHMPPHRRRTRWGFSTWRDFDPALWKEVKAEADAAIRTPEAPILASDRDPKACSLTSAHALACGLDRFIEVRCSPFERLEPPAHSGILIANPPYDERLKLEDPLRFYGVIGDTLKQRWSDWDAWLLSAHREALKRVGLRAARKIALFNGALPCSFQHFPLYTGSRR